MMETVTKQTKQQQQTEREGIVSQLSTPLLVLVLVLLDRRYTESPVYKMNVAVFSSLAVPNKPYGFCGR